MAINSTDIWIKIPDTPLFSYQRKSRESFESSRLDRRPRQIEANLATIDDIPSIRKRIKGGVSSSKRFRYRLGVLVTGCAVAVITILLGIFLMNLIKSNQKSTSSQRSTIATILITGTTITTTSATISNAVTTTSSTTISTTSTITSPTTGIVTTSSTSITSTTATTSTETTSTSSTSTTSSTTSTTATTSISVSPSLWSFENNTLDSLSIFDGVGVNSSTYRMPGINGYGSALSVNRTVGQYVNVSTYRNFSYTSFTIEMWFYCTALSGADYGLFGQYHAQTNDQSLSIQIRSFLLYMGFWGDDLYGSTSLQTNTWYHAAFVYDYSSLTQTVYLNGRLDGNRSSLSYQGTSGAIVIGKTEQVPGTPNYFSGYIDEVSLVMRAKNASEILDDATLVTRHSFDSVGTYNDSGPLNLRVTSIDITSVSGRVNQAISFTSNSSYYQVSGFVLHGVSNYPYSIALWVYPFSIRGSILVHLSTTTNGKGWCIDLMGFTSTGQIVINGMIALNQQVIGPVLPANAWTHVARTYSSTNGHRLYINGTLIGTTGCTIYTASGQVNILTLANYLQGVQMSAGGTCNLQSIVPAVYYGSIDEFRVYSRELNATDVYTLANP